MDGGHAFHVADHSMVNGKRSIYHSNSSEVHSAETIHISSAGHHGSHLCVVENHDQKEGGQKAMIRKREDRKP